MRGWYVIVGLLRGLSIALSCSLQPGNGVDFGGLAVSLVSGDSARVLGNVTIYIGSLCLFEEFVSSFSARGMRIAWEGSWIVGLNVRGFYSVTDWVVEAEEGVALLIM